MAVDPVRARRHGRAAAARSSIHLASSETVDAVSGIYFDRNRQPTPWPAFAVDDQSRAVIWRLCERLSALG